MQGDQLGLWQIRLSNCHFANLLEEDDNHCFSFDPKQKNEVLSCENSQTYRWLAYVRGVGLDVTAKPTPSMILPPFIPIVPAGSQKILTGNSLPFIATTLPDVISCKELSAAVDIRKRLGINEEPKIVVLAYGPDSLIEKIWPKRQEIFRKLAALDLALITAINYSVWLKDPHAERLINIKRGLLTFEDMQQLNMPAMPHIYWTGRKDLIRWANWLAQNRGVRTIAINLQTERGETWNQTLRDLEFFVSLLDASQRLLITGASNPTRARQLKKVIPNLTLSNKDCAISAVNSFLMKELHGKIEKSYSDLPKNEIFRKNIELYEDLLKPNRVHLDKFPGTLLSRGNFSQTKEPLLMASSGS